MKHIEVSKKIRLEKKVSAQELKEALVERLEKVVEIEKISEGVESFSVQGTTGSPASMTRHARVDLDVSIRYEADLVRILISGHSHTARSLMLLYGLLFFIMLLVGLLPGSIETNAETSGAMDALVFLVFGIFIVMDVNKKLAEPKEYLETALESLNTRFG